MERLEIGSTRKPTPVVVTVVVAGVCAGLFGVAVAAGTPGAVFLIGVIGCVTVASLWMGRKRGPPLVLDNEGISDTRADVRLRWSEIAGAEIKLRTRGEHRVPWLILSLHSPFAYDRPGTGRSYPGASRPRDGRYETALERLDRSPEEILALVRERVGGPAPPHSPPGLPATSGRRRGLAVLRIVVAIGVMVGSSFLGAAIAGDDAGPQGGLTSAVPTPAPGPPLVGPALYLVPLDGTPTKRLTRIGRQLESLYNVPARVLARRPSVRSALDSERRQLEADRLIAQLTVQHPTTDPRVAVVGVTDHDMWWAAEPGPFIFGVVNEGGYAVLSSAHMDPRAFGRARDEALLSARIEKMTARYLGRIVFDLQPGSPDPRSALRGPVVSLDQLDAMTDRFCPTSPGLQGGC